MTNKDEDRYLGSDHVGQALFRSSRWREKLVAISSIAL
jgi:hypothetical protein